MHPDDHITILRKQFDAFVRVDQQLAALANEIRSIAYYYAPSSPGEAGYEVEGRVIASDLHAAVDLIVGPQERGE